MSLVKPIGSLALILTLAACATPREQCITNASRALNDTLEAITVAEGNIARGYAIHRSREPYRVTETCYDSKDRPYACHSTHYRDVETPVSINVAEERRKRDELRASVPGLRASTDRAVAQCRAIHPE